MSDPTPPEKLAGMLQQASCCVALTGAGISTAAGIPDFRGPDGLYRSAKYDPETVFDIRQFHYDPSQFWDFTRELAAVLGDLQPTRTHRVLAGMESAGLIDAVITQNIDPFHALAGSENVLAVHGDYATTRCLRCSRCYDYQQMLDRLGQIGNPPPLCDCKGPLKPDVVFFGEAVKHLDEAFDWAARSDLMLVLGSSLSVQPAAMLPQLAGGTVVVINQGPCQLPCGPNRHFIQADLDEYFDQLARALG
ncbi:MAG: SIR2 family NAD-dependent protein deacylase, partial [Phycisphaerae bacterium]